MHWRKHSVEVTVIQTETETETEQMSPITSVNTQLSLIKAALKTTAGEDRPDYDCNQLQKLSNASASIAKYASAAVAENTRRAYQGDLRDFIDFGGAIPCTPADLAGYIAERAALHSPFTIARRVVGISRAHTSQGFIDPAKNDLVRAVLRGVRRSHGKPQRQVAPLMRSDLINILSVMKGTKGKRDRALILLGFAAALRRSELVGLNVENVLFVKEGIILHIQRSKTDQVGAGRKVAVPYAKSNACPVIAIDQWLRLSGLTMGPLFRPVSKSGAIGDSRLTNQAVALILKNYATAAGIDANLISGHSLRAGLATSAALAGVPTWKIKAQTGHKSDAMVGRYIREVNLFDGNAAGAVL
jgi:integrase